MAVKRKAHEPLLALNGAIALPSEVVGGKRDAVGEALMVARGAMMGDVLVEVMAVRRLAKEDQAVETLLLGARAFKGNSGSLAEEEWPVKARPARERRSPFQKRAPQGDSVVRLS